MIALAGCAAILATTRWPVDGWRFSLVDLRYYGRIWSWRGRAVRMTLTDVLYTVGLLACALAAAWRVFRLACRWLALKRYRPPEFQRGRWRRSTVALALMLVVALIGVGAGWPYRLGQRWIATEMAAPPASPLQAMAWRLAAAPSVARPPMSLTQDQESAALLSAVSQGKDSRSRIAALKFVVEKRPVAMLTPILLASVADEPDIKIRATEARLLGMTHQKQSIPTLLLLTKDHDATVRAAAVDALGIWHAPVWPLAPTDRTSPIRLDTDPSITLPAWATISNPSPVDDPPEVRDVLQRLMVRGETTEEREAAARALVNWPTNAHFRYAEWGVFQANTYGRLDADYKQRLQEIPAFAHRIPDLNAELDGRIGVDHMMPVWKPVIHLTTDRPIAVDIEVCLSGGRPWVAYPRFDDFEVVGTQRKQGVSISTAGLGIQGETVSPTMLQDLREGYPGILPRRRTYSWLPPPNRSILMNTTPVIAPPGSAARLVESVGLHWQSVIVSPTRLPWMSPADVGPDPRFEWWKRLRDVHCSWVSSRGESERFLYYDGPITRRAPVHFEMIHGRLKIERRRPPQVDDNGTLLLEDLLVSVTGDGVLMKWAGGFGWKDSIDLKGATVRSPHAAEADFERALQRLGLTSSEAQGLVACWSREFFGTPGRRYLRLISSDDYDELCPLTVNPQPTERVRVGVLWVEFPADK